MSTLFDSSVLGKPAFEEYGGLPDSASEVLRRNTYSSYPICTYSCAERTWHSLAAHILQEYGFVILPGGKILGGPCSGYDIKSQDAYTMIKMSLVYGILCGQLWECYVNADGYVKFIVVGEEGDASIGTQYLSVTSINYVSEVKNVLITGYKAPQTRRLTREYSIIDVAAATGDATSITAVTLFADSSTLADVAGGGMANTTEGWRVYGRVDWSNTSALEALFGVGKHAGNSFETISGFCYRSLLPTGVSKESSTIGIQQQSPRVHEISAGFSNSHFISWWNVNPTDPSGSVESIDGYVIPDTSSSSPSDGVGKWVDVQNVYVYGYPLDEVSVVRDGGGVKEATVKISTQKMDLISINRGTDYIVIDGDGGPRIVFANYVTDEYNEIYTSGVSLSINPGCLVDGALRDGEIPIENGGNPGTYYSSLDELVMFPLGKGDRGYAIKSIVIVCTHEIESIAISDTAGKVTQDGMRFADVFVAALAMNDAPAPMVIYSKEGISKEGYTKSILPGCTKLDQSQIMPDDDPFGTIEKFWDTQIQLATEGLGPGDIQMTLPFFDVEDLCAISENIMSIASEGLQELPDNIPTINKDFNGHKEVMVTCSPDSHPELGQKIYVDGEEYIVNEINYSYQDSSQYTITVTGGSKWVGSIFSSGWNQVTNQLKVENVTREGRVVNAGDSSMEAVVYVEGLGNIACVNTQMGAIIRNGDVVKVTIYNVPQGEV